MFAKGIETKHETRKSYTFKKAGVQLNFQLNIESERELVDFKSLLELAVEEIEKDLEKFE